MSEGSESLAAAASERVRAIVQAAEASAAEIEQAAQEDAQRIRAQAAQSTHALLERLQAMERELEGLVEELRSGAGRMASELSSLQAEVEKLGSGRSGAAAAAAAEPAAPASVPPPAAPHAAEEPAPQAASGAVEEGGDAEGARFVALQMALEGKPRKETAKFLKDNFSLSDPDALLDEVYASVG
ncbi:MAG TPA: hypothetical protein VFT42_02375 [Solirubrobacteraceae bacterium]|nr:hypothetical protein [Solirubrobacteraceae bacterium]